MSVAKAAPPLLRRWTPPAVEVLPGLPGADLSGVAVLAVPVAPAVPEAEEPNGADTAAEGAEAVVQPRPGAADAAVRYGLRFAEVCAAEKVTGSAGQVVRLPVQAPEGSPRALYAVGVGSSSPQELRRAAAALARAARPGDDVATTLADGTGPDGVRAVVEGFVLASYAPPRAGQRVEEEPPPARRLLLLGAVERAEVERALATAGATVLARDLAATPSNLKDPAWLAGQAREVALARGLEVEVLDVERLRAEGFGGLVAVGGGSDSPPCLVRVTHVPGNGAGGDAPHVVLVGKGITFDSGGLSLKPRESMVPMKTDMSGAAAVLGAVAACGALGVRARVTALLPLAENALGSSSYRPGDVVTHYGGRTSEVANTDAEGRMVMADALAYADAHLDPDVLVDVATLTGAASLGLGKRHGALFTADEELAAAFLAAADASGERLWRLPLVDDYAPLVDSAIADVRQVSADSDAGGGAIVAALFLRAFTGDRRWVHLDIAGPARADSAEHEVTRGATGFGARVLLAWLLALAGPPAPAPRASGRAARTTTGRQPARKPGVRRPAAEAAEETPQAAPEEPAPRRAARSRRRSGD
ncbi:leucyl aminopeptidase [Kineococcus xinjiangensis]|uniref:Probable cytosol aminopeptidase n=1 Tax=Kineococcus xinjiangensis TaxID=512762 RepID=A0A2S6IWU4_9ACTN|nr:leucyl aminopeptidase family protein [Kineococcus xinjiangensis]PPK98803.1 leucyl aminopeptidase [Kineococcus xinjiangensis]